MTVLTQDYATRIEQDTQWIWLLDFELEQWLELIRYGHIYGAIPEAARWYTAVATEMQRRGLTEVPEALRADARIRDAASTALNANRVQFFKEEAWGGASLASLWLRFLILELRMPEDEYLRWAESHRHYLLEQWAQRDQSMNHAADSIRMNAHQTD